MRHGLGWCVWAFMVISAAASVAEEAAETRPTYKVAVVPWVGWSAVHVAQSKGLWEKHGLDVRVVNLASNQQIDSAVGKGLVDIGFDMIGTAIGLHMSGVPVVVIAETDWSDGGDKIIVKQEIGLEQLKGKAIGVYLNQPSVTYFLNLYLSQTGLKLTDFHVVEMETGQLTDKFVSGLFGAIVTYDPDALRAVREGNGKLAATSATYRGCIPEGMMMRSDALERIPREDIVGILRGWIDAVAWLRAEENWQEYQDILNRETFAEMGPYSEEDLRSMVDAVAIHKPDVLIERNRKDGGLHAYLKELREFLRETGKLQEDFVVDHVFVNTYIMEALGRP